MNGFDISTISDLYVGSTQASAIYKGSNLIWSAAHDYSQDYLTIESLEDNNTIYWYKSNEGLASLSIEWSSDKNTWTSSTSTTGCTTITTLNTGDKIYVRGNNSAYAAGTSDYHYFNSTYNVNLSGNIMSLLYTTNFSYRTTLQDDYTFAYLFRSLKVVDASNLILPATTLTDSCYREMFKGCSSLNAAPALPATTLSSNCYRAMFSGCAFTDAPVLPATTLADYCYYYMFENCTSLTDVQPILPATSLANYCYNSMFKGCTSLTSIPNGFLGATALATHCYRSMFDSCSGITTVPTNLLPATTLAENCYRSMFYNCSSLTTAPDLLANKLVSYCYYSMFQGCTSLQYIKCLATSTRSNSLSNWVKNVAASGTFYKHPDMTGWTTGVSGIPSGWTVQNASL